MARHVQTLARDWIACQRAERGTPESQLPLAVFDAIWTLTHDVPEGGWRFIMEVMRQDTTDSTVETLSAGPLEDLLTKHGAAVIERVEAQARLDPRFARLLGGVWQNSMPDEIWSRVVAARDRRGWDGQPAVEEVNQ